MNHTKLGFVPVSRVLKSMVGGIVAVRCVRQAAVHSNFCKSYMCKNTKFTSAPLWAVSGKPQLAAHCVPQVGARIAREKIAMKIATKRIDKQLVVAVYDDYGYDRGQCPGCRE